MVSRGALATWKNCPLDAMALVVLEQSLYALAPEFALMNLAPEVTVVIVHRH